MKSLLGFYGAKAGPIGAWIVSKLPRHEYYVEPFGGMGGVLMQKSPSNVEVWNDRHDALHNLLTVVRDRTEELREVLALTPYSKREYLMCYAALHERHECPLEWARRTYVALAQSRDGSTDRHKSAWSFGGPKFRGAVADGFINGQQRIPEVAKRLLRVELDNSPAEKIINQWNGKKVCLYVDPPYVPSTRNSRSGYAHELKDDDHRALCRQLRESESMVLLSGYRSTIYTEELEAHGWARLDYQTIAHSSASQNKGGRAARVESLWLNPAAVAGQPMKTLFD